MHKIKSEKMQNQMLYQEEENKMIKLDKLYKFVRIHLQKVRSLKMEEMKKKYKFCIECERNRWKGHGCEECHLQSN